MNTHLPQLVALATLVAGVLTTAPAVASAKAGDALPIEVRVRVETDGASDTGQVRLLLDFAPAEDIEQAYTIALRIQRAGRRVVRLDHAPAPPTSTWRKGQVISYAVPAPLPLTKDVLEASALTVHLGFLDPSTRDVHPPQDGSPDRSGLAQVARFEVPDFSDIEAGGAESVLAAAERLATQGLNDAAWRTLVTGVRRAREDAEKYAFRDAMVALGAFEPRPISIVERRVIEARVKSEQRRYMRQMSGRFFDRKQYHASLRILEAIGGSLQEDADEAVLGAVDAVERAEKGRWDVRDKILERITDDEKASAKKAIGKDGVTQKLLARAQRLLVEKRYAESRFLLKELSFAKEAEVRSNANDALRALEKTWAADTPADQAQMVSDVVANPVWARTSTLATQQFILIGPKDLLAAIPAQSKLRFDIAYVFLTDLFGRLPNPDGDRVTVYFKELWEFSGGTGGGKQINIGRARPDARGTRLDTGLYYHELTHCIDDTNPVLGGWREGLANVGAAYAFEVLAQGADRAHSFDSNLTAFQKDYVERDLAYWRINNYGPSAGFFLHFVEKFAKRERGHDWKPLRGFFRDYRTAPVRDGRTAYVARAAAYYLVRHFGDGAFDDLMRFRLPLVESDREAIALEMESFARGVRDVLTKAGEFGKYENSPLRRDLITKRMTDAARAGDDERARRIGSDELGIQYAWRVIGPFAEKGTDPGACIFPPQRELDFAKEYPGQGNICKWRRVTDPGPVKIDGTGWVAIKYPYMDNTATYALTHVTVAAETPVALHVRADDDLTLFVNGDLVESLRDKGRNASSGLNWRGPHVNVPDAIRLPFTLRAGRNRILVKVRNRRGPAGVALAISLPDGTPVPGLTSDDGPADELTREPPKGWRTVAGHDFRKKSFAAKLEVTAGRFAVKNKLLSGQDSGKAVQWRKYTVAPGVSKDNPSNLFWLKSRLTEGVDEFRLSIDLVLRIDQAPKMVVTFQGDGLKDGLSGWNLILHGGGKQVLRAELERYQRLFHQSPPVRLVEAETRTLTLTYLDRRLTVTLGDAVVFDAVPIRPIRGAERIGVATWGREPRIAGFKLEIPKR